MEHRTINFYKISDLGKRYPIIMPLGLADKLTQACKVIFPEDTTPQPMLLGMSADHAAKFQELVDCALSLIENTQIFPNQPKPRLQTLVITDLPQMLRLVIMTVLSAHDASVANKYKRRIAGTKRMRDTKINNARRKAMRCPQNVVCAVPPQTILTQRRRWFMSTYNAYPEHLYAATVFYVLDYMMSHDLQDTELGMCINTIAKLVELATENSSKKRAAQMSVEAHG